MAWRSPPTRREISLLLFSLSVFIIFYNLESSFLYDPLGSTQANSGLNKNGAWDDAIYGDWTLEEAQVAKNALSGGLNGSAPSFDPAVFGAVGVNDGVVHWGDNVPVTKVLKHAPGYTILDNVYMLNGTVYIVTDDSKFPSLDTISVWLPSLVAEDELYGEESRKAIESASNENKVVMQPPIKIAKFHVLSTAEARDKFGTFGGLVHGVSWLAMDTNPSNYTLMSLWRTYSALDPKLSANPADLTLPPPRRIFFPHIRTYADVIPRTRDRNGMRARSPSGFHPYLAKAAFPTLALMYARDWADYALIPAPFVLSRVVVADEAAARDKGTKGDMPGYGVPLFAHQLDGAKSWWEPVRRDVARYVGAPEEPPKQTWMAKKGEALVTYLAHQGGEGPRLSAGDHRALIQALEGLGEGYRVNVVDEETGWVERMRAIAQSTVVIGVYGEHMTDCVFMPPSSRATVMELFPAGVFVQDVQAAVKALKLQYVAWVQSRQYNTNKLPPVERPNEQTTKEVHIDVNAIVQAIKRI